MSSSTKAEDEDKGGAARKVVWEAIAVLPAEVRSELIDDLLDTYCSMCAETLDVEGECPEGCDPEDMLDDDEDDDDDEEDEEDEESSEEDEGSTAQ